MTNAWRVHCYFLCSFRKATDFFDDPDLDLNVPVDRFELPEEKQELLGERIKAFNNLAQGQMKIEAWDAALAALGNVLKVEVNTCQTCKLM